MSTELEDISDDALLAHFADVGEAAEEEPYWIIDKVVPRGLLIIASPPKQWKSTVLNMLATLVSGHKHKALPDDMADVVHGGKVLGLSGEATPGEIKYMANRGFGCNINADRSFVVSDSVWEWRLDNEKHRKKLLRLLELYQPRMLFIDPLRNFHTQREDDSGVMIDMIAPLRAWAVRNDASVVVVHHTRKQGREDKKQPKQKLTADDLRGSSALFGMCDGLMLVTRENNIVTLDTVYKRGTSWCRNVTLPVWEEKQEVTERMLGVVRLHKKEGWTYEQICETYEISKATFNKWVKAVGERWKD